MKKTEKNCIRDCANVNLINRGIDMIEKLNDQINNTANFLGLAGNDTRMKMLLLINNEKKVCVCDLSDILGISVPAISQQLRKLKDGKILVSEKQGQTIYYHIHPSCQGLMEHILEIFNDVKMKNVA